MRVVVTAALIMHSCFGAMQIVSYEEASLFTQLAIQLASLYLHNSKSNLHHKQVGVWLHYNRWLEHSHCHNFPPLGSTIYIHAHS